MRSAPPLSLTVARFGAWRAAVSLLGLGASLAPVMWLASAPPAGPAAWSLAALLVGLAAWVVRAEWQRGVCHLRWDGQCWHWQAEAGGRWQRASGRAEVVIDLPRWVLLRLVAEPAFARGPRARGALWLPVQAGCAPGAAWHALRCAVYSRTPAAPQGPVSIPHTNER